MYSPRPVGKPDHHPEVADLLSVQVVAIKNLLGQLNFFIGHCILQNGLRHRTPAVDVIRSTAHSLASMRILWRGILQSRRCRSRVSVAVVRSVFETSFIKIGTVEMAGLSSFTWWHSS